MCGSVSGRWDSVGTTETLHLNRAPPLTCQPPSRLLAYVNPGSEAAPCHSCQVAILSRLHSAPAVINTPCSGTLSLSPYCKYAQTCQTESTLIHHPAATSPSDFFAKRAGCCTRKQQAERRQMWPRVHFLPQMEAK